MLKTLEEVKQSEEAFNQMNIGMQQISTAAEQIATGSENLSRHAGTAASDVKAFQEIFKKLSESSTKSSSYASQAGKTSEAPISKHFDTVFCRNVMIYFNENQKIKMLTDFYNSLSDGGYLVIGKSETLPVEIRELFTPVNVREKIFKKV